MHILDYKPDARTNKPIAQLSIYAFALTLVPGLKLSHGQSLHLLAGRHRRLVAPLASPRSQQPDHRERQQQLTVVPEAWRCAEDHRVAP